MSENIDVEAIASAVESKLVQSSRIRWVDPESHYDHHKWITRQISRERDYAQLREKILTSACIWAIPLILGFVGVSVWREVVKQITGATP